MALRASGISVADGRSEREREFLRLRGRGEAGREAGEIIEAESAAPDFGTQLMDGLLSGDAGGGRSGHPLGAWQQGVARAGKGALGSEEQQGVGSDGEGGGGFDGAGAADLRLAHAEQGFFLAEIDFDVPAVKVSFDDELGVEVFIGAEEKGGTAIEQLGTLAQAITEGGDDEELQHLVGAGGAPHQSGAAFEAQFMRGAVVGEGKGLPGRIVGADLFGSGSGRPVAEAAAARFLLGEIRPEEQMGILAEAADGGGVGGKVAENGLVGVASIEGDQEPARGARRDRRRDRRADRESVRGRAG